MLWVLTREAERAPADEDGDPAACEENAVWEADPLLMSEPDGGDREASLAPRFRELREGSLSLYRRVARLDEQAAAS
jgi:hypothetical protein